MEKGKRAVKFPFEGYQYYQTSKEFENLYQKHVRTDKGRLFLNIYESDLGLLLHHYRPESSFESGYSYTIEVCQESKVGGWFRFQFYSLSAEEIDQNLSYYENTLISLAGSVGFRDGEDE